MPAVFEHAIDLPQPPQQVFALLDDYSKVPLWLTRCEGVAKQGTGPTSIGDKLRYAYCEGGKHRLMDGVVTAVEQDRLLSYKYFDKMMMVLIDFRMTRNEDGGTHLVHRIEITPHAFLAKLMMPLIRMMLPKQTIDAMENLRTLLAREAIAA